MVSSKALSVAQYLRELPAERRAVVSAVRDLVNANIPKGFVESMQYGMIGWAVPLSRFPDTYNGQALAVVALAAQKNNYALYSTGAYGSPGLRAWFANEYEKAGMKLDMGGSCIRFKSLDGLLQPAVAKLVASVTPEQLMAAHDAAHSPEGKAKRRAVRAKAKAAPAAKPAAKKKTIAAKKKAAPLAKKKTARKR